MDLVREWITAVAALVGAIGIFFAAQQLWFGAWIKAQEIFVDKDFTNAREKVYARITKATQVERTWTADDYMVCRKMDEIARLAPYLGFFGFCGERRVLMTWLGPIAKSWIVLHSLVDEERAKTPGWKKWDAFEKLGKKAMRRLNLKEIPKGRLFKA